MMMRAALDDSHISPRAILLVALTISMAVIMVAALRLSGAETTNVTPSTAVQIRQLKFEDRTDGSIAIFDYSTAAPFEVLAPQSNGFLRGVMRGFARGRKLIGAGSATPFELVRWADGRMSLRDPVDGRDVALEPFGPTNMEVFKRLLTLPGNAP
jgi:putative photosynthetic complex assembly protein